MPLERRLLLSAAWFDTDWSYRKQITIDETWVEGTSDLTNFPVLISTLDLDWRHTASGGYVGQSDGGDILFTASDGTTQLDHEIETYNSSTGRLAAWVEVPTLDYDDDTVIYVYYGNVSAADQWDANATWNADFEGVWHLDTDGTDSTSNGFDLAQTGTTAAAGQATDALDFDGDDDMLQRASDQAINDLFESGGTIDAWVSPRSDGEANLGRIFNKNDSIKLFVRSEAGSAVKAQFNKSFDDSGTFDAGWQTTGTDVPLDAFTKVTVTYDASSTANDPTIYINGSSVSVTESVAPSGTSYTGSANVYLIGNSPAQTATFDGTIDEVRVSSTIRPADWIATEYNNQHSPATFYSIASQESTWYDADWGYRKQIIIDNTKVSGSSNLTDFPIVIRTTDLDWRDTSNSGNVGQADGGDFLFTSSDAITKIDHEIESYDNTTGELVAWVEIPTLDYDDDTVIYVYYGNAAVADQWDVSGTWDANFQGVWHLDGDGADSTSSDLDMTETSVSTGTGQIANGIDFDGDTSVLTHADDQGVDELFESGGTIDMWMDTRSDGEDDLGRPWSKASAHMIRTRFDDSTGVQLDFVKYFDDSGEVYGLWRTDNAVLPLDELTKVSITYDASSTANDPIVYVNGSVVSITEITTPTGASKTGSGSNFSIGNAFTPTRGYDGVLDEVRLSSTIRTSDWIVTEYNSQSAPDSFYLVSYEESQDNVSPFDNGWSYRKKIAIDHTKVANTDQTDFPVLISTTDLDWRDTGSGGQVGQTDGGDFLFTTSDGLTKLHHEIDRYDNTTGELVAWVRIPTLSASTDTEIYLYYGNASAVDQANSGGVWSSSYTGVWHLGDGDSTAAGFYQDSSVHGQDATLTDGDGDTEQIDGWIGKAMDFRGDADSMLIPQTSADKDYSDNDWTLQMWVRRDAANGTTDTLFSQGDGDGTGRTWLYVNDGAAGDYFSAFIAGSGLNSTQTATVDEWFHVALVFTESSDNLKILVNGTEVASGTRNMESANGDFVIGATKAQGTEYFPGGIDEVRLATAIRTEDWLATEYANQLAPQAFYLVGYEETDGNVNPSTNGWSYRKKITVDNTKVPNTDQTDFPVLVNTTDADWKHTGSGGNLGQADGGDILFTSSDGITKLHHEIESYDSTTGELVAWVRTPTLSSSADTDFYIYYGNASAVDQWNPTGVWDTGYKGVWHLSEAAGDFSD